MSKAGLKEILDLGGFPGIALETVPTPEDGKALVYVAALPWYKMGQIANPYFLTDWSYDRASKTAHVLPRAPSDWVTLPLFVLEK